MAAVDPPLPKRILDATEGVLRRHGAAKANVVDVARALGMSHANVYRYFANKRALLDAVAGRWLHSISDPLEAIAAETVRPAGERLAAWFDSLRTAKGAKLRDDPELFRVYHDITKSARGVVGTHVATLSAQLERIMADGVASGEFPSGLDTVAAARAFLQATAAFHHPALVAQEPVATEAEAQAVFGLLLAGLQAGLPMRLSQGQTGENIFSRRAGQTPAGR